MKILRGVAGYNEPLALTIGNFDGVHLGHRAMVQRLGIQAQKQSLAVGVMLFEPQPAEYLNSQEAPARLSSFREKVDILRDCAVDYVICLSFTPELANCSAAEFTRQFVFVNPSVQYLLVGQDFRYGRGRQGNFSSLVADGNQSGVQVESFSDFNLGGNRVSSTRIRAHLRQSEFSAAQRLLGRPYTLGGRVIHGDQRGRAWGIPTANIRLHPRQTTLQGVFHAMVHRANGQRLPAVANIGTRPTVDGLRAFLEVHLLAFDGNVYGERLRVEFLHKLRDEKKFSSVSALIAQIQCDIQSCYDFFNLEPLISEK